MASTDPMDVVSPETTALLVVDVQKAFAAESSPLVDAGVDLSAAIETVPDVATLIETARAAGLTVAFTRSLRRADDADAPQTVYDVVPKVLRGSEPICRRGSDDADYVDGVEPRDDEYEVGKVRYDAFHNTPLDYYLGSEGVDTVLVCGFATNVCVEGTARGAHERGYDVVLVEDCCAAFSPEQHEAGVRNAELLLGDTTTLDAVRETLSASHATQ